ncbi:MAG TPA: hypothetical protein VGX49_12955 [Jatrophihabitans sp.]|nr:hypothetical protein [Jatrophihabitans sp.]
MSNYDHESSRVDWLDLGPDPDEGKPPRDPRQRYLWYAAVAGLVVVALLLTRTQHGTNRAATSPGSALRTVSPSSPVRTPSPSLSSSGAFVDPSGFGDSSVSFSDPPVTASPGVTGASRPVPVQVVRAGHPLMDVPADWELFARGPDVVVRIQLALGRITTTTVPKLTSDTPVRFFVGSDRAIVRSLGETPGYVVRDEKQATELPESLRDGFSVLPSPDQQHLWAEQAGDGGQGALALLKLDGSPTGITIPISPGAFVQGPDGAGYVLLAGIGGVYDARPGSVHRITSGVLLASGPTRWLTVECDDSFSCASVVIDRTGGARHTLATPVDPLDLGSGVISPDGKTAALGKSGNFDGSSLHLLDLDSAAERPVQVSRGLEGNQEGPQFVWSPDSRWLFTTDAAGRVIIVNRATGEANPLGTRLVPVTQLALRYGTSEGAAGQR